MSGPTRRETLLLAGGALAAAPFAASAQEQPRRGGVLTVHFATEQRILNPSLQASTGVYIVGGKIRRRWSISTPAGNPAPCWPRVWEARRTGRRITFRCATA